MKDFWNQRYGQKAFAYGEAPNAFFKARISDYEPGTILFPAEGEGRNAVYAARLGWKVTAFDISEEGKKKAQLLANKHQVTMDYRVGDLSVMHFDEAQFDAVALIFAHFPAGIRSLYHDLFSKYLKKDGIILLEAFSKKHIEYNSKDEKVGGPKDVDLLYSMDEIKADFRDFEPIELTETEVELNEGLYHVGRGSVIRFIGRKK